MYTKLLVINYSKYYTNMHAKIQIINYNSKQSIQHIYLKTFDINVTL